MLAPISLHGTHELKHVQDFGTTYSSVAYAFSDEPKNVYTISDWPCSQHAHHDKCPTLIEYYQNGDFDWGFQVERVPEAYVEGIKLWLNKDVGKPDYFNDHTAFLPKKEPKQVAADYLRAIHQHSLEIIRSKMPNGYVDSLPKQYVLSVPAIWSESAKAKTLQVRAAYRLYVLSILSINWNQAAHAAGIYPVELINEPEAGALSRICSTSGADLNVCYSSTSLGSL